jgi:hypothetical protein
MRGNVCAMRTGEPDCEEGDRGTVSSSAFSEMVSEMFREPMRVSMWSSERICGKCLFASTGAPRPLIKIYRPRESSPGEE